jgi:spermidine synthase
MPEGISYPIRGSAYSMTVAAEEVLCRHRSAYQLIEIFETEAFGRMLLLDGHVQLAERDEAAYHETLVHMPLLSLHQPKSALVIGGGDGGVIRELVKHPVLSRIVMVDIDQDVIECCRRFLPSLSADSFEDPRVELIIADAFAWLEECDEQFDLVISDITHSFEAEGVVVSQALTTERFFAQIAQRVAPRGMFAVQADNPVFCREETDLALAAMASAFPAAGEAWAIVPSFGGFSSVVWGGSPILPHCPNPGFLRDSCRHLTPEIWAAGCSAMPFAPTRTPDRS